MFFINRFLWKLLFKTFLIFSLTFILTSCFEIIEEVSFNEDGSGTFVYTVNMSQSKTKLNSIMLMDTVNGYKVPSKEDISHTIDQLIDIAKKTDGISRISKEMDFDEFIFSFQCDFTNVISLNELIKTIQEINQLNSNIIPDDNHFVYNATDHTFARNANYFILKEYEKLGKDDTKVFDQATYVSINRFKKEIKNFENNKARISPNKKALMLRVNATDLIKEPQKISNKITLSK